MATISSSETFTKRRAIFLSVCKTVNMQGIFQVPGANQNARKLLSTDMVNTNDDYQSVWHQIVLFHFPNHKSLHRNYTLHSAVTRPGSEDDKSYSNCS